MRMSSRDIVRNGFRRSPTAILAIVSFNFRIEQVTGRQEPIRALLFHCSGEWYGNGAFLSSIDGRLLFSNQVVSEPVRVARIHYPDSSRTHLWRGLRLNMECAAILPDASIRLVEDSRASGDVGFQLELRYQWQDAELTADSCVLGAICADERVAQGAPIARSRWLALLAEMEWSEIEVFELQTWPYRHFEKLPAAVPRLRQAEAAYRNGDWNGVLGHCRAALEAAAKAEARSDDVKKGFELLFGKVLPEHQEKRIAANSFVTALTSYAHLGRHERFPALQITRSEAEFIYTSTLALFSFLGRRLSKLETFGPEV